MKACPVCHARTFDDAEVCYGCLYRFGSDLAREQDAQDEGAWEPDEGMRAREGVAAAVRGPQRAVDGGGAEAGAVGGAAVRPPAGYAAAGRGDGGAAERVADDRMAPGRPVAAVRDVHDHDAAVQPAGEPPRQAARTASGLHAREDRGLTEAAAPAIEQGPGRGGEARRCEAHRPRPTGAMEPPSAGGRHAPAEADRAQAHLRRAAPFDRAGWIVRFELPGGGFPVDAGAPGEAALTCGAGSLAEAGARGGEGCREALPLVISIYQADGFGGVPASGDVFSVENGLAAAPAADGGRAGSKRALPEGALA